MGFARKFAFSLTIVALLAPASAWATRYIVATNGHDANDGRSEAAPFRTVGKCVATMNAGDTCLVREGIYNQSGIVRFGRSGTKSAPIKLLNYPGESPVIDCVDGPGGDTILIQNFSHYSEPMGWITIDGFEIRDCYNAIKWYNLHDSQISHNWIHHNNKSGILAVGGTRVLFANNIFNGNSTPAEATNAYGIYAHGSFYTIINNVFYDSEGFQIQHNGSSSSAYDEGKHAGPEFSGANDWIVAHNTFAYSRNFPGYVIWGPRCTNLRLENNIFYENRVNGSDINAIQFLTSTALTGVLIRNNISYATGSGGTAFIGGTGAVEGSTYFQSGNIVNGSRPGFVNGGSNALPGVPNWTIASATSAAVGVGRVTEFLSNTHTVGAFDPVASPTASIAGTKVTLNFSMNRDAPLANITSAGLAVSCTSNPTPCPAGGLSVVSASRKSGTDGTVELLLSGFDGNGCSGGQDIRISYAAGQGTWETSSKVGPMGAHPAQKVFSFTGVLARNNCSGVSEAPSGSPHVWLKFDGNDNDSSGNGLHGAQVGSPTFVDAKLGQGMQLRSDEAVRSTVPYGNGVTIGAQPLTIVGGVFVEPGSVCLGKTYGGVPFSSGQFFHWSTYDCTWRIGIGSSAISDAASEFSVTSGDHHVCINADPETNTVTLTVNGVTGTTVGSVKSHSDFVLPGDFSFGLPANFQTSAAPNGVLDDWKIFTSKVDCSEEYAAWSGKDANSSSACSDECVNTDKSTYLPGEIMSVTVQGNSSGTQEWVAVYDASAPDSAWSVEGLWQYLGGSKTEPASAMTKPMTLTFNAPSIVGTYNVRYFSENGFGTRLAVSDDFVVSQDVNPCADALCGESDGCCPENCLGSDLDCTVTGTVSCTDDGKGGKICSVTDLGCSATTGMNSMAVLLAAIAVLPLLRRRRQREERRG